MLLFREDYLWEHECIWSSLMAAMHDGHVTLMERLYVYSAEPQEYRFASAKHEPELFKRQKEFRYKYRKHIRGMVRDHLAGLSGVDIKQLANKAMAKLKMV
jgi:hypothetical protein